MKKLFSLCNRMPLLVWLFVVGIFYYLLISQNIFVCDDFGYAMASDGGPLRGLTDIIDAQTHHYFSTNGRFLVHCVVMAFAGIWGMPAFRVCSTVMFVLLVYEIYYLCGYKYRSVIPVVIIALMILLPAFNITILGNIATVTNYLWVSVFFFAYVIGLEKAFAGQVSNRFVVVLPLFALVTGTLQESFSIGGAAASLLLLLMNWKKKTMMAVLMIVCFFIGTAIVVFAPANFSRAANVNEGSILFNKISSVVKLLSDGWAFLCFIAVLVICWYKEKRGTRTFLKNNIFLFAVLFVSLLFACIIAYLGPHQMTVAYLILIILTVRMVIAFCPYIFEKYRHSLATLSFLLIVIMIPSIYSYRHEVRIAYEKMLTSAANSVDGVFYSQEYYSLSYRSMNWLQKQFTTTELVQDFPLRPVSLYLYNGKKDRLLTTRLPYSKEGIYQMCQPSNEVFENVYYENGHCFYIVRIPNDVRPDSLLLKVDQHNSTLGYLRNLLTQKENPDITTTISTLDYYPSFRDNDYSYFICKYKEEYDVVKAELLPNHL